MKKRKYKRRILRRIALREVSMVDTPAQEGARAVLFKRAMLTNETDGHAHRLEAYEEHRKDNISGDTSHDAGHSHPWVMRDDGSIAIGASTAFDGESHAHTIAVVGKRKVGAKERRRMASAGSAMSDGSFPIANRSDLSNAIQAFGRSTPNKRKAVARHIRRRARALQATDLLPDEGVLADLLRKNEMAKDDNTSITVLTTQVESLKKQVDAANAELAHYKAVSAMSDAERVHLDTLDETSAAAFVKMAPEARKVELAKARDADPVVYTTSAGVEIRKSNGTVALQQAQTNDALLKRLETIESERNDIVLEKRVGDEIPHLSGTVKARSALLKAIDGLGEDERTEVQAILKAADTMVERLTKASGRVSTTTDSGGDSPEAELQALAKRYAKDHDISETRAYAKVLNTPEGRRLYSESVSQ